MDLHFSNDDSTASLGEHGLITLPLLSLITQARNEHGMRQQDFQRYRQFCTKKVHRLRVALQKTHTQVNTGRHAGKKGGNARGGATSKGMTKKAKRKAQSAAIQSEKNKGKGNIFVRKTIAVDEVNDDRPMQLLLFEAERAWAYAQELRQASFEKDQDGVLRGRGLARARRAVQWSQRMLDLLTALGRVRVDLLSRAEASAYHVLLQGYEAFDKNKHEQSLTLLSVARKLFHLIGSASNDSRTEALANSYVDRTEPMLRFCAYNLGHSEQSMDKLSNAVATLEASARSVKGYCELVTELEEASKTASAGQGKGSRFDEVEWRGKQIPIRNPDLVEVMNRVREMEEGLRASLSAKRGSEAKFRVGSGAEHKRQRLTSAQRSAKKRGQTTAPSTANDIGSSRSSVRATSSKTEMDGFDSLLAALTEAEDVARHLVQDNAEALSKSHSGRYEASSTSLTEAHEYIYFKLLATRTERNAALMDEVQAKCDKRQGRVRETISSHIQSLTSPGAAKTRRDARKPVRRRVKQLPEAKVRPPRRAMRSSKKPEGGKGLSMDSMQDKKAKKKSPRTKAAEERLRQRGELKARRIAVRIIPGLAKLLDNNEMSCAGMANLSLIEKDPNLSTLIEAKSAWYKAELLRLLSRSFAWSSEPDRSLVLLTRAELYVREARSAMELVEMDEVEKEDGLLPPRMGEATFVQTTNQIAAFRLQVQRDVYCRQLGATPPLAPHQRFSVAQSKAAQAVRDMASKYVDFDPVDLQQATNIPPDVRDQIDAELVSGISSMPASRRSSAAPVNVATAATSAAARPKRIEQSMIAAIPLSASEVTSSTEEEKDVDDDGDAKAFEDAAVVNEAGGPYDPANILAEEEERAAAEAAAAKRGWLGGWLSGRKA